MIAIPNERPNLGKEAALQHLGTWDWKKYPTLVLGIRGYYSNSIGKPGNDFGAYDDAAFILSQDHFSSYNFNTDPQAWTKGRPMLLPNRYFVYKLDLHKGSYLALCQRLGSVTVLRNGGTGSPYKHVGNFGINIHSGGINSTNSEGCQTIPPLQYPEFIFTLQQLDKDGRGDGVIPYVLVEQS